MNKTLALTHHLSRFVTDHKLRLVENVLQQRTRHLTIMLEDIFQSHNASAVIRSCECFGIQDLHIVEQNNRFHANTDIALGASKWLDIQKHETTSKGIQRLKQQGYRIVAATLHDASMPIQELEIDQKTAVCFGTELSGLSEEAHQQADCFVKIPMYGFTQSFNISVSVALMLFSLTEKLRASKINWHLTDAEREVIKLNWLTKIVPHGALVKTAFLQTYDKN